MVVAILTRNLAVLNVPSNSDHETNKQTLANESDLTFATAIKVNGLMNIISTVMTKTYGLIRNIVSPAKPSDKTYDELITAIRSHLKPKPLIIAERFKFHQRKQKEGETVSQFLAHELRKLSEHCNFEGFLNDALRDRFVCGLTSAATQRKLLSEADLTLKRAMDIAVSMELADCESRKLKESYTVDESKNEERAHKVFSQCFRCGKSNHSEEKCYYKNSKCHKCKETGHLSKMCKSRHHVNTTARTSKSYKYTIDGNLEDELFQKYEVFNEEELGTVKGVTATLRLQEKVTPKFFKPRPVPFALRDKISNELERLEKAGILKRVESSDWGTPIVPVL
ncbi:uncharacterized protein [Argopecten irradians]|uniref:uncharacterized protein n=1 Tax=Argopecten irradians TaxID=31199 RepID=UPI00371192E9